VIGDMAGYMADWSRHRAVTLSARSAGWVAMRPRWAVVWAVSLLHSIFAVSVPLS